MAICSGTRPVSLDVLLLPPVPRDTDGFASRKRITRPRRIRTVSKSTYREEKSGRAKQYDRPR